MVSLSVIDTVVDHSRMASIVSVTRPASMLGCCERTRLELL